MKKLNFVICLFLIFLMPLSLSVKVQGFFKKSQYVIPLGKNIFLGKTPKPDQNLCWISENTNVAEVNNDGIVVSKKQGKTRIQARYKDDSKRQLFSCEVVVADPETVRAFYVSPNVILENKSICFHAVTNKNVSEVHFKYRSDVEGIEKSEKAEKKFEENGTIVWEKSIKGINKGSYLTWVVTKLNNKWIDSKKNIIFEIKNKKDILGSVLSRRTVTDKCLDSIYFWEGCHPNSIYKDPGGNLTSGSGRLLFHGTDFYINTTKTENRANLIKSVNGIYTDVINKALYSSGIKYASHHFDALVSFTYNVGIAWISNKNNKLREILLRSKEKDLNNVNKSDLISNWLNYHHCSGTCLKGLLNRRISEVSLFLEGKKVYKVNKFNPYNYPLPQCCKK